MQQPVPLLHCSHTGSHGAATRSRDVGVRVWAGLRLNGRLVMLVFTLSNSVERTQSGWWSVNTQHTLPTWARERLVVVANVWWTMQSDVV
jgi:hypothetical protein